MGFVTFVTEPGAGLCVFVDFMDETGRDTTSWQADTAWCFSTGLSLRVVLVDRGGFLTFPTTPRRALGNTQSYVAFGRHTTTDDT